MKKTIKKAAWDATLNTDVCDAYNNADLTITLNLGFKQINPASGKTTGTYHDYGDATEAKRKVIRWTSSAWDGWKRNFIQSAEKFWDGKFWLINNFSVLSYKDKGQDYIPNIWCCLDLKSGDATSVTSTKFHHVIEVVRLDPSETWFGSHSKLYDNLDTNSVHKGNDSKGNKIMQRAHVHEIGHLLGLGHVDIGKAHCPSIGDTNASKCYGVKDADKYSVMGSGMELRPKQANPWRKAIKEITSKGDLNIMTDWEVKLNRFYPRTPAEVASKKHFMRRPKRV